jgi:hypothetical protein
VAEGGFHEWRNAISRQSRRTVGVVLFLMPTVLFGAPRLRNLLSERPEGGGSLSAALMEELKRFTGEGWEQEDDITLLTLECSAARS